MQMPLWVQLLWQRVGAIIAIIVGVPTMIYFIKSIWSALSDSNRIIAVVSGTVLLVCIVWFIINITKKELNAIPSLLNKMHKRLVYLASNLNITDLDMNEYSKFMSLTMIDADKFQALKNSTPDIESLIGKKVDVGDLAREAVSKINKDSNAVWRLQYFMFDSIGLKDKLEKDKHVYQKLFKRLNRIKIPNTEIKQAIIDYNNTSKINGTWLSVLHLPEQEPYKQAMELNTKIDSTIKIDEQNNTLELLETKIRGMIERYYKGK